MGQSLNEIAQILRDTNKKVQLIYAFNGVGKTRLSREFKELISPKSRDDEQEESKIKILYYNAFTEDLFYWDNDLEADTNRKLKIQPNNFTDWVLREQGQEPNIAKYFQQYTNDKLTPNFNEDYSEITFSLDTGDDKSISGIKISKGEESCLIWCVFFSVLKQAIDVLTEHAEPEERETNQFDDLKFVFIDDPVSSLDENHLIELAVDLAELIKKVPGNEIRFIISTHNPLFYNVLCNELKGANRVRLDKFDDGTYNLERQNDDSPFSYQIFLLTELERCIENGDLKKVHFNYLRQILEKTSTFLGQKDWENLLPRGANDSPDAYYKLIVNLCSHAKHSGEETYLLGQKEKSVLVNLVEYIKKTYHFKEGITV